MGILKVGTIPPGPSEKRMVMKENTAPSKKPTQMARRVIWVFQSGSEAKTSSSDKNSSSFSCSHNKTHPIRLHGAVPPRLCARGGGGGRGGEGAVMTNSYFRTIHEAVDLQNGRGWQQHHTAWLGDHTGVEDV